MLRSASFAGLRVDVPEQKHSGPLLPPWTAASCNLPHEPLAGSQTPGCFLLRPSDSPFSVTHPLAPQWPPRTTQPLTPPRDSAHIQAGTRRALFDLARCGML